MRVVVVDDQALLRRRLVILLESEPDVDVVAEAPDGEHAIGLCRDLAPDVVVIGMRVESIGGPRTAAGIREVVPSCHIVMLISADDEIDAVRAIKAGTTGFINRDTIDHAPTVVRAVAAGAAALPPLVAQRVLAEYETLGHQVGSVQQQVPPPALTDPERALLVALAGGRTYHAAAAELGVGDGTAKNLVTNTIEKLYRHARTEAVLYAVGERLFHDEQAAPA